MSGFHELSRLYTSIGEESQHYRKGIELSPKMRETCIEPKRIRDAPDQLGEFLNGILGSIQRGANLAEYPTRKALLSAGSRRA